MMHHLQSVSVVSLIGNKTNGYSQPAVGTTNAAAEPGDICFCWHRDAVHGRHGKRVGIGGAGE